mmetsp:Transcript_10137/g.23455  ORF Transcript_10137/g.23455 Transcript_10137/m.23455 type:complete len:242 (+) Transcript_10137:56-781(+)
MPTFVRCVRALEHLLLPLVLSLRLFVFLVALSRPLGALVFLLLLVLSGHRGSPVVARGSIHTGLGIRVGHTTGADIGSGSRGKPGTDRVKNIGKCQGPPNHRSVDIGRGHHYHTTLLYVFQGRFQNDIEPIRFGPPRVLHALLNRIAIDMGSPVNIPDTVLILESWRFLASTVKLCNVVPPLQTNSVGLSIFSPYTNASQTFLHNIRSGNALFQVIVGIGRTVSSVVRAEIFTDTFIRLAT